MVKNPQLFYKWIPTSYGASVPYAVTIQKSRFLPSFYIARVVMNGNSYIGRVMPGIEMEFIDVNGKKRTSAHYQVLTCRSPKIVPVDECTGSWIVPKYTPVKVLDSCSTKLV
jgi:hypothetical protein